MAEHNSVEAASLELARKGHRLTTTVAELLELQQDHWLRELQRYGYRSFLTDAEKNRLHLALCQHMADEVGELVHCADWKIHARGAMAPTPNVAIEIVDLLKFAMNLATLHGIGATELVQTFGEKSFVVARRVRFERLRNTVTDSSRLLVCDIDGVLCDRDSRLLEHAKTLPSWTPSTSIAGWRRDRSLADYERLKTSFYESGKFESCDPIPEAVRVVRHAAEKGCRVLLVTSRDVKRHPRLEWETHRWLDAVDVPYEGLIFSSEKERAIATWAPKRCVAVDDELDHVRKYSTVCEARHVLSPSDVGEAVARLLEMP